MTLPVSSPISLPLSLPIKSGDPQPAEKRCTAHDFRSRDETRQVPVKGTPDRDRPARLRDGDLVALASHATDRDLRIAEDCYEHRVLTTHQLQRLHFPSRRSAALRLQRLYELRVLERFRPPWTHGTGSTPFHWVLDTGGAHLLAAARGLERHELAWARQSTRTIASSATLAHCTTTNDLVSRLIAEVRAAGGQVPVWLGERGARELLGGIVIPDSYLHIEPRGAPPLHLLLELDRGTEDHNRLLTKARRYAKALPRSPLATLDPLVLLVVPSERRARTVAATLANGSWPIAVHAWTPDDGSPLALVDRAVGARPVPRTASP
jgi:protein involved in plasmid replication-relaxation